MNPKLVVQQKITAFVNKYAVYTANPDGTNGAIMAFAQQKRLAFKEKVTFYTDESKTQVAFTFRAEKVFDVHGRYIVEDASGAQIGSFKKDFAQSLLSSTWRILDTQDQPHIVITESNMFLAIARRTVGLLPFIGDILEIIILFLKYHFVFSDIATSQPVGRYQKTTLFRDHYLLSMTDEAYAREDPRVLAAMAVGLDALQSR
jgi:hypothetical protein